MAPRSKVLTLPAEVKAELDHRLVATAFSDYEGLADWLEEQGYAISRSSLGRYGQSFESRLGALRLASEQARAIVLEMGDDAGDLGEALTAVAQQKTFDLLMNLVVDPGEVKFENLMRSVAQLNATGVQQKKWRADVRARVQETAQEVGALAKSAGLTDEAADVIREKILGIKL